jgi:hypothetical protein
MWCWSDNKLLSSERTRSKELCFRFRHNISTSLPTLSPRGFLERHHARLATVPVNLDRCSIRTYYSTISISSTVLNATEADSFHNASVFNATTLCSSENRF